MKYTIDQDNRRIAIELSGCDKRGYYNVPLAKAILRNCPSERFYDLEDGEGKSRAVTVSLRYVPATSAASCVQAEVTLQLRSELTDEKLIGNIKSRAQAWLSGEMSRLNELRESLDTLKEAYEQPAISED